MHIISIELENIKSYEFARIEFTEGVNAIVGHNGAGKSTLLEAVGFALFSCLDYNQHAFLREGTKQGSITVSFESQADERVYEVVKRIGGAGVKQFIYDPELGAAIAENGPDVDRFLRAHMGLPPDTELAHIFRDAVGVPQGTLTAAFLLRPAQRKSVFDALLQVEEYKNAFDRLLESKNLLLARKNDVSEVIARLEGALAALPGMQAHAVAIAQELKTTSTALAAARTLLVRVEGELHALEEKRVALVAAQQESAQARAALAAGHVALGVAENQLHEAQAASARVAANQAGHDRYLAAQVAKDELDARRQHRQQLAIERSNAAAALAMAEHQRDAAAQQLAHIAEAESRVTELAAAAAREAALEAQRAAAMAQQGEYRGAQSVLQQCEQTLAREETALAQMQTRIAGRVEIEAALAEVGAALAGLAARRTELDAAHNTKLAEGISLKQQSDELDKIEGARCPICEAELTPEHRRQMIARNAQLRAALRMELGEIKAAQTETQGALDVQEALRNTKGAALHSLPTAADVADKEAHVVQLRTQRDASQARCAELAAAPATLAAIEAELQQLGSPRQHIAIARASADKRPQVEAEQARAETAHAAAAALIDAFDVQLADFAGLDAALEAVQRETQETQIAYQTVLANRQIALGLTAREDAVAAAALAADALQAAEAQAASRAAEAAHNFDASAYTNAQAESARLHGEVGSLATAEAMLTREGAALQVEIGALQEEQAKLVQANAKLKLLKAQYNTLLKLRDVIKAAGPHVIANMIQQVSASAAQIFGELTGDFAQILKWGDDYGITLEVAGREREFSLLSGGEQMVAALAVRLALLRTMSGISTAFFDEPTAHLDGERRAALAEQIVKFKGLRQLFVISHDDTFEQATANVIHLERVDGVSCVVAPGTRVFAQEV